MAVPYSIGRKIEFNEEDSELVVSMLTNQLGKLYQFDGTKYIKKMPNKSSNDNTSTK